MWVTLLLSEQNLASIKRCSSDTVEHKDSHSVCDHRNIFKSLEDKKAATCTALPGGQKPWGTRPEEEAQSLDAG